MKKMLLFLSAVILSYSCQKESYEELYPVQKERFDINEARRFYENFHSNELSRSRGAIRQDAAFDPGVFAADWDKAVSAGRHPLIESFDIPIETGYRYQIHFNSEHGNGCFSSDVHQKLLVVRDKVTQDTGCYIMSIIPLEDVTDVAAVFTNDGMEKNLLTGIVVYSTLVESEIVRIDRYLNGVKQVGASIFNSREYYTRPESRMKGILGDNNVYRIHSLNTRCDGAHEIECVVCYGKRGNDQEEEECDPYDQDEWGGCFPPGEIDDGSGGGGGGGGSGPEPNPGDGERYRAQLFNNLPYADAQRVEAMLERLSKQCIGLSMINYLSEIGTKINLRFDLTAKNASVGINTNNMVLNSYTNEGDMLHEIMHLVQFYGGNLQIFETRGANLEVEAQITYYHYVNTMEQKGYDISGLHDYEASANENNLKKFAGYLDKNGRPGPNINAETLGLWFDNYLPYFETATNDPGVKEMNINDNLVFLQTILKNC